MEAKLNTRIRKARELKAYSQALVSEKLGITQKAYSKLERGETKLNWDKLNQLSEIFEIDIWELINTKKELTLEVNNSLDTAHINVDLLEKLIRQYEDKIKSLESKVQNLNKENQKLSSQLNG